MTYTSNKQMPHYRGLEQLICAALANQSFASALIADPAAALSSESTPVRLTPTEYALAASIRSATDIHDFAARLLAKMRAHASSSGGAPGQTRDYS